MTSRRRGSDRVWSPKTARHGNCSICDARSRAASTLPSSPTCVRASLLRRSASVAKWITPGAPRRNGRAPSAACHRPGPAACRPSARRAAGRAPGRGRRSRPRRRRTGRPARGSSMCTTSGTPSMSTSSTAGASRSMRSSLSRPAGTRAIVDVVASSGRTSRPYARTCRPGQPETSARPQQEPGDRCRRRPSSSASLRAGVRIVRSASSTSSRSAGRAPRAAARSPLLTVPTLSAPCDQRVGPAAVEVEEADRLRRQQVGVGDEVAERHACEQPQPGQPAAQLARARRGRRRPGRCPRRGAS